MIFSHFFKRGGGGQHFKLNLLKGATIRKAILGLVVLVSLMCVEALGWTQEQIKDLDKQCKDGDSFSCTALGEGYLSDTEGFSKDYKKAKFYFEKVCKKGNEQEKAYPEACGNLGMLYYKGGYGVPQDLQKALKLFTLACDKGAVTVCQNLGAMYSDGKGVPRDVVKGAGYFRRACYAGAWTAYRNFALYHYDSGNQSKAAQYFKKACELGKDSLDVRILPIRNESWDMYNALR